MIAHRCFRSHRLRAGASWLLVVLVCLAQTGCVQRRLTVRSNPPGALVYVDKTPIGTTPVSTSFTYYGAREFKLVKGGYETLTTVKRIWPPWYEIFPLDFISENLIPREIRDHRVMDFQLAAQQVVPEDELRQRAEGLRQASHVQAIGQVPPGPTPGVLPPPPSGQFAGPSYPRTYLPPNPTYNLPPGAKYVQPPQGSAPSNANQPVYLPPNRPAPYGGQPSGQWLPAPRTEQILPGSPSSPPASVYQPSPGR